MKVAVCDNLDIKIHDKVSDAPHWRNDHPEVKPLLLEKAHVVRKGMVSGRDTVDLVLTDADGKTYIAFVTGSIVKMLAATVNVMDF